MHKKLRSKRLAPVLIKEVTRQCHLKGTFQAIYTAGIVIPTPISTCRYYHRTLNVPKLVDVKFTYVPRDMTIARMIRQSKVSSTPSLARSGLREMEERDVSAVGELFRRYMERFDMIPMLDEDDIRHQFLSGLGTGEKETSTGRRQGQVVWTYVVEVRSSLFFAQVSFLSILRRFCSIQKRTRSRTSSHSIRCPLPSWRIRDIHSCKPPISITTRPTPPL